MTDLTVLPNIQEWTRLKQLVLDSVASPITKRVYNMALDEFLAWFQQAPRTGFTKATVSAWRVSLEERRLGSSSIIIRMSAIRKLINTIRASDSVSFGFLPGDLDLLQQYHVPDEVVKAMAAKLGHRLPPVASILSECVL